IAMFRADGHELFRIPHETMHARFGGTGMALLRSDLIQLLLNRLGNDSVRFGSACVGFEQSPSAATADFEDGSQVMGCALVGADGFKSTVRSQLFGTPRIRHAGYTVWRGVGRIALRQAVGFTSLGAGAQFGVFPMS